MKRDCRRESQRCRTCLRHNVGKRGLHPLRSGVTMLPMEKVNGNIVGPFYTSEGCRYVLVLVDAATRYCWLRALSEITAEAVAREMILVFAEFGWPSTFVSDGGTNMSKGAVSNILELVGAEARVTVSGAHEQNSAAERTIREVRQVVTKTCEMCPREWKTRLPLMQMEMNDRISERTKSAPFTLMFARRRGVFPGERVVEEEAIQKRNQDMLEVVYPEIAKMVKEQSERACEKANDRRTLTDQIYTTGDLVMHEQVRRSKNQMRYEGPFHVKSYDQQKRAYILEQMDGKGTRGGLVLHEKLKKFRGSEEDAEEEEEEHSTYEVMKVHDVRAGEKGQEYLVKWKGYKEKTWENEENMGGAERVMELFWGRKEKEDEVKRRTWTTESKMHTRHN